ncbi:MAG: PepSY-associated TM helix domain-containing protein [Aquisalimonadaceae bacterium]
MNAANKEIRGSGAASQPGFRLSMAWLHTWTGLLLGWLLYFIFITGTAGYLDTEIDRWMQPELPPSASQQDPLQTARAAQAALERLSYSDSSVWYIDFPIDRNKPYAKVWWQDEKGAWQDRNIDARRGEVLPARETAGGQLLYRMHWQLHYLPRTVGEWIVGLATLFMMLALVTGIIVHKKIFKDFFTFRPGKGQRSWLDAHNLVSVLSLPFQLMITYSGLIFLMFTYMPLIIAAWYGPGPDGRKAFFDEAYSVTANMEASGQAAELVALETIVAQAQRRWGSAPISSLEVKHPNDAGARVIVHGDSAAGPIRSAGKLVFDGVSGELLRARDAPESVGRSTRDLLLGLHEGLFAGPVLRALYVLSGLLGAAMIASGLILWTVKRRQRIEKARQAPHGGLRLVEKLNVASIVGLPVAIAAYFWGNRLLPLELGDRAQWEAHILFLTWLALFLHAGCRSGGRAWREQLWLGVAAFGLLPLVNALTSERHLAVSLPAGDWVMAGFDLAMLTIAAVFAAVAWLMHRKARAALIPALEPAKS